MLKRAAGCGLAIGTAIVLTIVVSGLASARSLGVAVCATKQLRITISAVPGGADHLGAAVRFANRGTRCTLRGYPDLAGVTASGRLVVRARRTRDGYLGGAKKIKKVVVDHGQTASALYEGLDGPPPGHACPKYGYVRITPPGDRHSVHLRDGRGLCSPEIHPVIAGRTGNDIR